MIATSLLPQRLEKCYYDIMKYTTFSHEIGLSVCSTDCFLHYFTTKFNIFSYLKLYCGYKYTRYFMINRVWGVKQLSMTTGEWSCLISFARALPTRKKGKEAKIQNENICIRRVSHQRPFAFLPDT